MSDLRYRIINISQSVGYERNSKEWLKAEPLSPYTYVVRLCRQVDTLDSTLSKHSVSATSLSPEAAVYS